MKEFEKLDAKGIWPKLSLLKSYSGTIQQLWQTKVLLSCNVSLIRAANTSFTGTLGYKIGYFKSHPNTFRPCL